MLFFFLLLLLGFILHNSTCTPGSILVESHRAPYRDRCRRPNINPLPPQFDTPFNCPYSGIDNTLKNTKKWKARVDTTPIFLLFGSWNQLSIKFLLSLFLYRDAVSVRMGWLEWPLESWKYLDEEIVTNREIVVIKGRPYYIYIYIYACLCDKISWKVNKSDTYERFSNVSFFNHYTTSNWTIFLLFYILSFEEMDKKKV